MNAKMKIGLAALLLSFAGAPATWAEEPSLDAVRQALEYMQKLVKFLPPDAQSWDDASNNKWLIAGKGADAAAPAPKSSEMTEDELDALIAGRNGAK